MPNARVPDNSKMEDMGSEESFQDAPAIQVPMTSEERLLRRLGEVDRCVRASESAIYR